MAITILPPAISAANTYKFDQYNSLAHLCAEHDVMQEIAETRIGGSTDADDAECDRLEAAIGDQPADCTAVALWRAKRLVRAIENDWRDELLKPLALVLASDLANIAGAAHLLKPA